MTLRLLHYSDIENAYDEPERIGRLAGLINRRRTDETIVCGTGDNTAPGVLSLVTEGRQSLDFFRAIEPDVDTFGNHDFDYGFAATREIVWRSPQVWVSANVHLNGERFATEHTTPFHIIGAGAYRVGIVGVSSPDTPEINPAAEALAVTDPIEAVVDAVDTLRKADVDYVVVLSHCGDDSELAREVDVDVILGGHDHDELIERVDETLCVRPGACGTHLIEVNFEDGRPTATRRDVASAPTNGSVAEALRSRMDEIGLVDHVTTFPEPVVVSERTRKRGESRVGNLVVDASRWRADADVALQIGGLRECGDLEGTVTAADLIGLCPFDNDLVVVALSGGQLREAFRELSVTYRYPDAPAWWFGHVSGANLVWDDRNDSLVEALVGDEPLDPTATYEVAVASYYVESDHLFSAFGPDDVVRTVGKTHEAVVEYARTFDGPPSVEGRIDRPTLEEPRAR